MLHLPAIALVLAAVALAYANAPSPALIFDARVLIAENPALHDATAAGVGYLLTHDYWQPMTTDGLYRPITTLSFLVDYAVLGHGPSATGYVIENVALHGICAVLVYALVWALARRRWPAVVTGVLFAVHPVTTEAVTNVVGRADLLAAAGVLAGLVCWAHASSASGARRLGLVAGLGVAAVVAFFSKESGLVLAAAVLVWDVVFPPPSGRRLRTEHVVVAVVLAIYLGLRWWVDRIGLPPEGLSPVDNPLAEAPFVAGRLTAVGVLLREIGLVLWPATLSIDYSYRQIPIVRWPPVAPGDWIAVAGVVAIGAFVWTLARLRRTAPALCFLGAFAGLALLPSANLVRLIGSIMAERFLYLPLAGAAGLTALVVDRWAGTRGRRVVATALVGVVAVACAVRTAARNVDWHDERALWAATVRAAPESAKAHKAYATALLEPDADPQSLAQVIAQGEQAVTIRPDYQHALVDLGSYYILAGDRVGKDQPAAALLWYEKAVGVLDRARAIDERATARFVEKIRARGHPDDTIPDVGDGVLFNNLALADVKLQHFDDARAAYERMRQLAPTSPSLYRDIAALEQALGHTDETAVALWQALSFDDDDADTKQRIVDFYRATAPADAGIVTEGPSGEIQIHTAHPIVRRHRCRAWRGLDTIFTRAQLPALAERAREEVAACGEE